MKSFVYLFILTMLALGLSGCAVVTKRHVQAIDSSESSVKFLFTQQELDHQVRGVIECDLVDGDLRNCRELEVEYR